jgi:hypothetical protein
VVYEVCMDDSYCEEGHEERCGISYRLLFFQDTRNFTYVVVFTRIEFLCFWIRILKKNVRRMRYKEWPTPKIVLRHILIFDGRIKITII